MAASVTQETIDNPLIDGDQSVLAQVEDLGSGVSESDGFDHEEEVRRQNEQGEEWTRREQGGWIDEIEAPKLKLSSIKDIRSAPPLQYVIQDILIRGWTHLLSGLPGIGKSLVALLLALAVASGKPFLNTFPVIKPGPVLIIDSENPGSLLRKRFDEIGIPDDLPIKFLHYQPVCLDNEAKLNDLLSLIADEKSALVIFDSLVRFHSKSENSSDDMKIVTGNLNRISRLEQVGSAALAIHHAAKNSKGGTISRGSTEINAGVDVEYGLTEAKGIITLQSYKTRVESFDPIKLQIKSTDNRLGIEVVNLGTHVNNAALTNVKFHLEESIKQNGQFPNQGEFKILIVGLYPGMGRPAVDKIIQDGIDLRYWKVSTRGNPCNAILYEPV